MAMAYWKGMTWGVTEKEIAFLESFSTSFGIETTTNADKDGNSPTEQVAPSLVEFSLKTTYRIETGTRNIRGIIDSWKALVGQTGPLIIGSSTFGPDKMQLQSVGVSDLQISASGIMRAVTLSFKFKEFSETSSGVSTVTNSGASAGTSSVASTGTTGSGSSGNGVTYNGTTLQSSRTKSTAVNIGAAKSDRESKKTVNIKNNMIVRREIK